ncbi:hypothetical protein EEB15_00555 [Ramlibacter sp. WS9]|nr:hypothetical protein EEB15_00555 [Ramlibacter sp. WS9]
MFVYVILKQHLGKDWDLASLGEGSIRSETRKRINDAKKYGYLGYEVSSPMLFLSGGELTALIGHDAYWKYFARYFKASKEIVLSKLLEIGTVRNALAHFRPVKEDDIDLIKQNTRHILLSIEDCLVQLTSITDIVPTNSAERWYSELKSIGAGFASTVLMSSKDENWIRASLRYEMPTLRMSMRDTYLNATVANLRAHRILLKWPDLKDWVIYLSESKPHPEIQGTGMSAVKAVSLVFARSDLVESLDAIVGILRQIALQVESETQLLQTDNLARGDLVDSQSLTGSRKDEDARWSFNTGKLDPPVGLVDDVEYWGQRYHFGTGFVASTTTYPWMPATVSNDDDDIPF